MNWKIWITVIELLFRWVIVIAKLQLLSSHEKFTQSVNIFAQWIFLELMYFVLIFIRNFYIWNESSLAHSFRMNMHFSTRFFSLKGWGILTFQMESGEHLKFITSIFYCKNNENEFRFFLKNPQISIPLTFCQSICKPKIHK